MTVLIGELISVEEWDALQDLKSWLEMDEMPTELDLREWLWRGDW